MHLKAKQFDFEIEMHAMTMFFSSLYKQLLAG